TVLLVDAGAMSFPEALPGITRARQVVAFGDPVVQQPTPFTIGVGLETPESTQQEGETPTSALTELAEVLPEFQLTQSYRAGGADLVQLVNERFYRGEIESLPWAGTFPGPSSITDEFVEGGQGLPDREAGAVESPDAEVERVVQLVLRHASQHPRESLMVITVSPAHAVRVQQAV